MLSLVESPGTPTGVELVPSERSHRPSLTPGRGDSTPGRRFVGAGVDEPCRDPEPQPVRRRPVPHRTWGCCDEGHLVRLEGFWNVSTALVQSPERALRF